MKKGILFVVMGAIGVGYYLFYQLSGRAVSVSEYIVTEDSEYGAYGLLHLDTITTHDWTAWVLFAALGAISLIMGIGIIKNQGG